MVGNFKFYVTVSYPYTSPRRRLRRLNLRHLGPGILITFKFPPVYIAAAYTALV